MPPRKRKNPRGPKPKYCFMMKKGGATFPVCAPVKRKATSDGAGKVGNFSRHKITKGYSSGKRIMRKTSKKAKAKKPQTQTAIKRLMKLRRRRAANKRYVAKKKTGTVRKAGSRTGVKYRKRT
jgi:hypothetical protein